MRRFTTSWSYGVTAWKTSRCRDSCGCDFGSKHGTRSVQRDWLGIIARHPPVCVRGRVCARARARVQNKCNSFSRFVFVLAENRKAGGVREEVEGGTGALNGAACGVRLYILFYFIKKTKRKQQQKCKHIDLREDFVSWLIEAFKRRECTPPCPPPTGSQFSLTTGTR